MNKYTTIHINYKNYLHIIYKLFLIFIGNVWTSDVTLWDWSRKGISNFFFKYLQNWLQYIHFNIYIFLHIYKIYGGKSLLDVPFSTSNINLYGTKLLDILFTKSEQANGTIEPVKSSTPSLQKERVDLIKSKLFLLKFVLSLIFNFYFLLKLHLFGSWDQSNCSNNIGQI